MIIKLWSKSEQLTQRKEWSHPLWRAVREGLHGEVESDLRLGSQYPRQMAGCIQVAVPFSKARNT